MSARGGITLSNRAMLLFRMLIRTTALSRTQTRELNYVNYQNGRPIANTITHHSDRKPENQRQHHTEKSLIDENMKRNSSSLNSPSVKNHSKAPIKLRGYFSRRTLNHRDFSAENILNLAVNQIDIPTSSCRLVWARAFPNVRARADCTARLNTTPLSLPVSYPF
jgi:hypothetical protein